MKRWGAAKFVVVSNKVVDELLINQCDLNTDKLGAPLQCIANVGRRPQILMRPMTRLPFLDWLKQTLNWVLFSHKWSLSKVACLNLHCFSWLSLPHGSFW